MTKEVNLKAHILLLVTFLCIFYFKQFISYGKFTNLEPG